MDHDEVIISRVLMGVSSIANRPLVRNIEDHYAAYFDELGITVNLTDQSTEMEWQELAIDLLDFLNKELPKNNDHFRWILSFWHKLRQVGLFFPGDTINSNCAKDT
ncbi:hypothetical protein [Methyloglobulus sp.]|uniref:hypothetical protein n=1 Tax=Methyloglobulus sp. TaxID=2518622 RepID=UPI0032B82CE0